MDCAPSVDVLHTAALVAADRLIIPTQCDQFAVKGVAQEIHAMTAVLMASRSELRAGRGAADVRGPDHQRDAGPARQPGRGVRGDIWPVIPRDNQCRLAHRSGKTLWEEYPKSQGAERVRDQGQAAGRLPPGAGQDAGDDVMKKGEWAFACFGLRLFWLPGLHTAAHGVWIAEMDQLILIKGLYRCDKFAAEDVIQTRRTKAISPL